MTHSQAAKKLWASSSFRKRMQKAMTKGRRRRSRAAKFAWNLERRKTSSDRMRKRWRVPGYRDRISRRCSVAGKRRWSNPKERKKYSDTMKKLCVNGGHVSEGARKLYKVLGGHKFGWVLEFKKVDIAHPGLKIAVEVDGKSHLSIEQKERDGRKEKKFKSLGWSVFRVSEDGCRHLKVQECFVE